MTFADFRTEVLANLDVDANRRGTETLRDRTITNTMVDLQRYIAELRTAGVIKDSFSDPEHLPVFWTKDVAEAVAERVKHKLVLRYDRDPKRAEAHEIEYNKLRLKHWRTVREIMADIAEAGLEAVAAGETWYFDADELEAKDGTIIYDVTGYTFSWALEPLFGGSDVVIRSTANGTVTPSVKGFTWLVPDTLTAAIVPSIYVARHMYGDPFGNVTEIKTYLEVRP